jgi:hypothetical protein
MKAYRYLIYKLYSWALKKKNDTPVFNVIITITVMHYFQLLTIYCILFRAFHIFNIFSKNNGLYVGLFMVLFIIFNYFILYNKKRWANYLCEFENEDERASFKGKIYVLSYLIGSILLFFFSVPLIF